MSTDQNKLSARIRDEILNPLAVIKFKTEHLLDDSDSMDSLTAVYLMEILEECNRVQKSVEELSETLFKHGL